MLRVRLKAVGALTAGFPLGSSTNVSHTFRPWEVQNIDGIDLMDSCLGSIRYQIRGGKLVRILPRVNDDINGEWCTDKGRYAPLEGTNSLEITTPMIRVNKDNTNFWDVISNNVALIKIKQVLQNVGSNKVRVVFGATTDCETVNAMKEFCTKVGASLQTIAPKGVGAIGSTRSEQFERQRERKEVEPKVGLNLIVGYNPRIQSPLFNLKLREQYLEGSEYINVGPSINLTYPVRHAGFGIKALKRLKESNMTFSKVIVGSELNRRDDASEVSNSVEGVAKDSDVNIGRTRSNERYIRGHEGSNELDNDNYDVQILVNISANEVDAAGYKVNDRLSQGKYNIIVTSKGGDWMKEANLIVPVLNALQVESTYVSRNGGVRRSSIVLGNNNRRLIPMSKLFETLNSSTFTNKYAKEKKELSSYKVTAITSTQKDARTHRVSEESNDVPFRVSMVDYHLEGHPIAENSRTMARCSAVFVKHKVNFN